MSPTVSTDDLLRFVGYTDKHGKPNRRAMGHLRVWLDKQGIRTIETPIGPGTTITELERIMRGEGAEQRLEL